MATNVASLNLRDLAQHDDRLAPGHRLCAGCGESIIVRQVLLALDAPVVVASATGCLEIGTSPFPYTSWKVPWIHVAFENAATVLGAVEAVYRSWVRRGKIPERGVQFVAFGGDGATYDIGLQFLSGAMERGHKMIYVCLNNEAYMNTGIQRSSATILGTWTTTTPVGAQVPGKTEHRKDLTAIMADHQLPYVAQASPHNRKDLMTKVRKAAAADGPAFLNILASCNRGWRHDPQETIAVSKLAAETCIWPLYEVENGTWKLNYQPRERRPIVEWLRSQGRFSHLLRPENVALVEEIQRWVDDSWERLQRRCAAGPL
ncbi:MAG: pyruvate ferredoxin oxidoreductase [Chloroflexi bacterium]|nr:pyruvate ferredoxin oxidoreductase [Chloroflexota bacterium]